MRVLLTGNKGFIGREIEEVLTKENAIEVHGLDCDFDFKRWRVLFRDFRDTRRRERYYDYVIHCGAVADSGETGNLLWQLNYQASCEIADYCERTDTKLIFISSAAAIQPDTAYGWSKQCAEFYMQQEVAGMNLCILRPFNVWGFDESEKANPSIVYKILTGQLKEVYWRCVRDFIYISDVVSAVQQVVHDWTPGIFSIGTAEPTSVSALAIFLYGNVDVENPPPICRGLSDQRIQCRQKRASATELGADFYERISTKLGRMAHREPQSMKIEYFINSLKHRPERTYAAIGALDAQCFPMKNVHIVYGKYWADFDDLFEAICADGFSEELAHLVDAKPGYQAGTWSFFRIFRAIEANQIAHAMIFEDDFVFKRRRSQTPVSYKDVKKICEALPKDFKIGILGYRLPVPNTHRTFRDLKPVNKYWGAGVVNTSSSHNIANIYSLDGVGLIRETALARTKGFSTTENLIGRLHEEEGVYSLLDPIIGRSPTRGKSDGMPHTNRDDDPNLVNVNRWAKGFNVDVQGNRKDA